MQNESARNPGWWWRQGANGGLSSTRSLQVLPPQDDEFDEEFFEILSRAPTGVVADCWPRCDEEVEFRDTRFKVPVCLPWFEVEAGYALFKSNEKAAPKWDGLVQKRRRFAPAKDEWASRGLKVQWLPPLQVPGGAWVWRLSVHEPSTGLNWLTDIFVKIETDDPSSCLEQLLHECGTHAKELMMRYWRK